MLPFNKSTIVLALLIGACLALAGCDSDDDESLQQEAMAEIAPTAASGSNVTGEAVFTQDGDDIMLTVDIRNASPGLHAVHIHEAGDCSAPDGASAGGHWAVTIIGPKSCAKAPTRMFQQWHRATPGSGRMWAWRCPASCRSD